MKKTNETVVEPELLQETEADALEEVFDGGGTYEGEFVEEKFVDEEFFVDDDTFDEEFVDEDIDEPVYGVRASYSRPLYLTSPQMYGSDVKSVQNRLKELKYNPGTIDGYFGSNTKEAVKKFQDVNGLDVDGSVGPATWPKLFSSTAKENTTSDANYLIKHIDASGSHNDMCMKVYENIPRYESRYCIKLTNYSGTLTDTYFKNGTDWNNGKTGELYTAIVKGNGYYDDCKGIISEFNLQEKLKDMHFDRLVDELVEEIEGDLIALNSELAVGVAKKFLAALGIAKSVYDNRAFGLYAFNVVKGNFLRNQII